MVRRIVLTLAGALLAVVGVVSSVTSADAAPAPTPSTVSTDGGVSAEALPICASNAICFAEGGISFQSYWGGTPRNTCKPVSDNRTEYIDNETAVQWKVFLTTNCTGTVGTIFANSSGPMAGIWWRSIGSTFRTSTP